MSEKLTDLIENLRDPYWWADRPVTRAAVAALVAGLIGLACTAAELTLKGKTNGPQ